MLCMDYVNKFKYFIETGMLKFHLAIILLKGIKKAENSRFSA